MLGAKAGYCPLPLHSTPPKGWANPSGPTPGHNPTLIPRKESDLLPASGIGSGIALRNCSEEVREEVSMIPTRVLGLLQSIEIY